MKQHRTTTLRRPSDARLTSETTVPANDPAPSSTLQASEKHDQIAVEAYLLAEQRGFAPGFEIDDWLAAEAAVDAHLQTTETVRRR